MKKKLFSKFFIFFLGILILLPMVKLHGQDCDFTITTSVSEETCPGNGQITVNLNDTEGKNLSDFRYTLYNSSGSNIGPQTNNVFGSLNAGTYEVVVDAYCNTTAVSQNLSNIVVNSSYNYPDVGLVQGNFSPGHIYGSIPSFPCQPSGKIQLRIEQGTFPYIIEIMKDGALYRRDTFSTRQYNGNADNRYDFRDYYTIDNLSAGDYIFRVTDGCGYSMPFVSGTVAEAEANYQQNSMYIFQDPPSISSNIIRFSLLQNMFGNNSFYYYAYMTLYGNQSWWEYRINIDGVYSSPGWKDITGNGTVLDTLPISNYCALNGKSVTVTVRNKVCPTGSDFTHTFSFGYPNINSSYVYSTDSTVSTPATYDSCGFVTKRDVLFQHTSSFYQQVNNYRGGVVTNGTANFYYTPPVTIVTTNVTTGNEISRVTGASNSYNWRQNVNITPDMDGNVINITSTDANGCIISNHNQTVNYRTRNYVTGGGRNNTTWQINNHYQNGDNCGQYERRISIIRQNPSPEYLDSTVVRLIQSPENNRYNFTALYRRATNNWIITKENPTNTANIYSGNDTPNDLEMAAIDLPSGTYQFSITTACRTETINRTFAFPSFIEIASHPVYEQLLDCGALDIIPRAGQVTVDNNNVTTYFRVIAGPSGGYPQDAVTVNNPIRLTIHGDYTLRMYSSTNANSSCGIFDTIINYYGATIQYDYLEAYVCSEIDTIASVNVRGMTGKKPYTYTVSKDSANTNIILGTNTTGDFGDIRARLGERILVSITDSCGASFETPATVVNLESTRKAWFANNSSKELTICEGSTAIMNGLSLGDVEYTWRGPNGFISNTQNTERLVRRALQDSGWYYLEVANSYCPLVRDSIHLSILTAPSVNIAQDASICPGEDYPVILTPHGDGNITYTVATEMNNTITTRTFSNRTEGDTDTMLVTPLSNMLVWLTDVQDERCNYQLPEDTIEIRIKSTSSSCRISPFQEEVCYDGNADFSITADMNYPYVINWYRDEDLNLFLKSDTIRAAGQTSTLILDHMIRDTTFYLTAQNEDYCAYQPGVSDNSINMNNGTTLIECGESIRFFDSGGPEANYSNNEVLTHTFVSQTPGSGVNIRFDSFITENSTFDKMYIYDGGSINSPVLASELGGNLNTNLPGPFTSTGDSLTILFVSNFNNTEAGWSAMVGVRNGPVPARVVVLDTLSAYITSRDSLPIHYNGSTVLDAQPSGGHDSYIYKWYTSADSINWTLTPVTTANYAVTNLTTPTYYRVVVLDNAPEACTDSAVSNFFLDAAAIVLSLNLNTTEDEICPGDFPVNVTIRNDGSQTATNVYTRIHLPFHISMEGATNLEFKLDSVPAKDSVIFPLNLEAHSQLTKTSAQIKGQIWGCDQGDSNINTVYGDWNWEGDPRQVDEDTLTIQIKRNIINTEIITIPDTVCRGSEAHLTAEVDLPYPQYFYWYMDSLGRNLIQVDTIENASESPATLNVPGISNNITRYVTVSNEEVCAFYVFDPEEEELVVMGDGLVTVYPDVIVRFFDSGGPFMPYDTSENYTLTFTSLAEDMITITFTSFITDSIFNDYLYLYDGNSTNAPLLTPPMRGNLNALMPLTFTTTGGSLTVSFQSNDSLGLPGWEASITTKQQLKPVEAVIREYADPAEIQINPATICYGMDTSLTASSTITFPQTFVWYSDSSLTDVVYTEIVNGTSKTESRLTMVNPLRDTVFYVTVGNDSLCALNNTGLQVTNYKPAIIRLNVNPVYNLQFTGSICLGETFTENDWSVNTADTVNPGTYTYEERLLTVNGNCDSIRTLELTILPALELDFADSVCHGDIYSGYDWVIRTEDSLNSGIFVYTRNLTTANGLCDSIRRLTLTVFPSYINQPVNDTVIYTCNFPITVYDSTFFGSETKRYIVKNQHGCDSLIREVTVYMNNDEADGYYFELLCRDDTIALHWEECEPPFNMPPPEWSHYIYDHYGSDTNIRITHNIHEIDITQNYFEIEWEAIDDCGNFASCIQKVYRMYPPCDTAVDYNGNRYPGVQIGCNCWTQRNLESLNYADGRPIPDVWVYYSSMYSDSNRNEAIFGRLYSWYAAVDTVPGVSPFAASDHIQGICPDGWHLPTIEDYRELMTLSASSLKSPDYWIQDPGDNSTGFTALPAGYYNGHVDQFYYLMGNAYFWASDETPEGLGAYYFELMYGCDDLLEKHTDKHLGYSIRCLKRK